MGLLSHCQIVSRHTIIRLVSSFTLGISRVSNSGPSEPQSDALPIELLTPYKKSNKYVTLVEIARLELTTTCSQSTYSTYWTISRCVGEERLELPVLKGIDLQSTRLPITGYSPKYICCGPDRIRTRDSAVKGRRLRPLVDGNINLVGLQRFELWKTAPKTVVLPLHHSPI